MTDPPTTSMFKRCGGESTPMKKGSSVKEAVVDAVQQIASVIVPNSVNTLTTNQATLKSTSPSRLIDSRSKCYKQLAELKSFKDSGVLSENEYAGECEAILNVLKKLGSIST